MNEPIRYSSSQRAIGDLLTTGRTGCLVSEAKPQGPRVYTLLGQIVAVVAEGDGDRWVELLLQAGRINRNRAHELRRALRMGHDSMDLLASEVSSEDFLGTGGELIKENLIAFLRLPGPAWFEPMNQLFVSHLQVHHDTGRLLTEAIQFSQHELPSPAPAHEPPPVLEREESRVRSEGLHAFEDHDRNRVEGQGEFTVQPEHLDVVDLGPSQLPSADTPETRFSTPGLDPERVLAKVEVCNQVLRAARDGLKSVGIRALPRIQALIEEPDTDFSECLSPATLDVRGELSVKSIQMALYMRPTREHRRVLEKGLLDLMERVLDLCAEHLDESLLDRLLYEVAGFRQRLVK